MDANHLDQLMAEKSEVAKKLAELDAKNETGPEHDKLRARHKELTEQIEALPNADEMDKVA
jgi:hypothetical protein